MLLCYCLNIAQQIIDDWLKDDLGVVNYTDTSSNTTLLPLSQKRVKVKTCHKRAHNTVNDNSLVLPTEWSGDLEKTDYITGMDFVNTDISQCVEQVMAGMYTRPVEHDVLRMVESQQTVSNPVITMEMRHEQVT